MRIVSDGHVQDGPFEGGRETTYAATTTSGVTLHRTAVSAKRKHHARQQQVARKHLAQEVEAFDALPEWVQVSVRLMLDEGHSPEEFIEHYRTVYPHAGK